jgi:hypothetical protein
MKIRRRTVPAGTTLIAEFPSSDRGCKTVRSTDGREFASRTWARETVNGARGRKTVRSTGGREFVSRTWARETVSSMAIRHIGKIQEHDQGHRAFARTEG